MDPITTAELIAFVGQFFATKEFESDIKSAAKGTLKNMISRKKELAEIHTKLQKYFEDELKHNESALIDEEIDFDGLRQFLSSERFLSKLNSYLIVPGDQRENIRNEIIYQAQKSAKPKRKEGEKRAEKIADWTIAIVYNFYRDHASQSGRLLIGEAEEKIAEANKKLDSIQDGIEKIAGSLSNGRMTTYSDSEKVIERKPVNQPEDAISPESLYLIIPIDENGQVVVDTKMRNGLLQWLAQGQKEDVHIKLDIIRIKELTNRHEQLQRAIDAGTDLNAKEEYDYIHCVKEIERLGCWAELVQTASECFLKDSFMHTFCQICTPDDYLKMLSRIISFDPRDDYRQRKDNEHTIIDFTVSRSNANHDYYFSVPISDQTLKDLKLNPNMAFMDVCFIGIEKFDRENRQRIYTYFYRDYAGEILYRDKTIQDDTKAKNLMNYNLGVH